MVAVAVFLCGATAMALEILAFRVLQPTFGSEVTVTVGSIISLFLGAMALGYAAGGLLADRWPDPRGIALLILAAGLLTLLIDPVRKPVIAWGDTFSDYRVGAAVATLAIFGPSTVALAAVAPYAVRLLGRKTAVLGRVAGDLSALSTVGSITGTVVASFYLLNAFRLPDIFRGLGLGVLVIGVLMLFWFSRKSARPSAVAASLLLAVASGPVLAKASYPPAAFRGTPIYEKESRYHQITVAEDKHWRVMRFGLHPQAGMLRSDPFVSVFRYTDAFHLAMAYNSEAKRVLFVGLGGGTGPKQFRRFYPQAAVDAVDIDPDVVDIAQRFFGMTPDLKIRSAVQDGRQFLRANGSYDVIILDAYHAQSIPFHLTTQEFMRIVRQRLNPKGVVVANVIGSLSGRNSKLVRSEYKTMASVFPRVLVYPILEGRETISEFSKSTTRNVMLVATTEPRVPPAAEIAARADALAKASKGRLPHLSRIARSLYTTALPVRDVPLLTDDYAPVDELVPVF